MLVKLCWISCSLTIHNFWHNCRLHLIYMLLENFKAICCRANSSFVLTLSCSLASESLVGTIETNQLIIKLLHTVQRHVNIPEKVPLLKSPIIYIPACNNFFIVSSRTIDSHLDRTGPRSRNFLLISFCDYCHHSMHTITALAIGVGLKTKQTVIPANMERRRSSITSRQVEVHLSAPWTPSILPLSSIESEWRRKL